MKFVLPGGAGAMGRVTVRDLLSNPKVTEIVVADINPDAAEKLVRKFKDPRVKAVQIDIRDIEATAKKLKGCQVMINCSIYYFNLQAMEVALAAGMHYIDLGGLFHMTRQQMELSDRFREAGLTAVLGTGSTPGITNVMARYAADGMDTVKSIDVKIGCIDLAPASSTFAAPYSMHTILDEVTKNPVIFQGGDFTEVPPFSGEEEIVFPSPIGKSLAHYTLHSEVATFPISYASKGISQSSFRIAFPPDFARILKLLVDLNLASSNPVKLNGVDVVPRDLLIKLLGPPGTWDGGTPDDCDCLRVEVVGRRHGRNIECTVESLIFPHKEWGFGAGAVDTGIPPSIIAQMLANNEIKERGAHAPETCVPALRFFEELGRRGIHTYSMIKEHLA